MKPSAARCLRRMNELALNRAIVVPSFIGIAFLFVGVLFLHPMNLGHGDWLWHHFIWETARKSWLEFHEPPWWNPYCCGGNLGIANPQGFGFSPFFLALLPFPTAIAMKAHLAVMTFTGLWGTYELCRWRGARGVFAIVAAIFFACSGFMGWHMNGQTGMAAFDLLPWAILFYLRGFDRPAWSLFSGATLACMILTAGVYPSVLSGITMAIHALVVVVVSIVSAVRVKARLDRGGRRDRDGRLGAASDTSMVSLLSPAIGALRSGAVAALSMITFGSLKLFPLFDFLRDHRRPIPTDDAISPRLFLDALVVKRTTETQIWPHDGYAYAWWGEYGNYIGWLGIALVLIALGHGVVRRRIEVILAAIFAAIVLGEHGALAPYHLLRSLPMLGNLRVPTRYFVVLDLWLALLIALAGHELSRWLIVRSTRHRSLRGARLVGLTVLGALPIVLVIVDMIHTNGVAVLAGAMPTAPAPETRVGLPFKQVLGHPWQMYKFPPINQGTLRCFDEVNVEISPALRPGLPAEVFLDEPDAGTAKVSSWSPSTWRVKVDTDRATTLVLNQNVFRGWASDAGPLVAHQGLIAVDVAAGQRDITFAYRPPGFGLAIALTLGTLLITVLGLMREMRELQSGRDGKRVSG